MTTSYRQFTRNMQRAIKAGLSADAALRDALADQRQVGFKDRLRQATRDGLSAMDAIAQALDEHEGFSKLERSLAHRKGVTDPKALAAAIGRKKYGERAMERRSQAGR